MDMSTNKIAWKQHYTPRLFGDQHPDQRVLRERFAQHGGGLTFVGIPASVDHAFAAYDATSGKELARFKTDAAVQAPPMTYSVNGKQYVAVYAGGNVPTVAPYTKGDSLYVYALG